MAVILTEEQKKSPLYKYYELDIAPVPQEKIDAVMSMSFSDNTNGLPIEEINRLFDEGYLEDEFGLFGLPDGGCVFSNLTDMPGVTPEMFDWWFAWHGLDSMRYTIWDKDDHYYCQTQNVEQALDASLSMKERFWNTTHEIKEAIVDDGPALPVRLTFVPPVNVGFDPEKLASNNVSIVCTPGPALMIHFVRETDHGSELRTRFYFGYMATQDGVVRISDFPGNDMSARMLLLHNIKEFTHLAKILPSVYAEFKDDFLVGIER